MFVIKKNYYKVSYYKVVIGMFVIKKNYYKVSYYKVVIGIFVIKKTYYKISYYKIESNFKPHELVLFIPDKNSHWSIPTW